MHASLYIARSSQIIPDPSPLPPSPSEPSEAPQDGRREVLEIWIQDLWNTKLGHIDRSAIRRTLERLEELAGRPVPFEQFRTFYGEQSQDKSLLAPHIKSSFAVASSADRWGTFLRRIDRPKRLPPARREPPKLDESTKAAARRETTRMLDDLEDRELAGRIRAAARTWGKGAAE
jgi:hypothetical protein